MLTKKEGVEEAPFRKLICKWKSMTSVLLSNRKLITPGSSKKPLVDIHIAS